MINLWRCVVAWDSNAISGCKEQIKCFERWQQHCYKDAIIFLIIVLTIRTPAKRVTKSSCNYCHSLFSAAFASEDESEGGCKDLGGPPKWLMTIRSCFSFFLLLRLSCFLGWSFLNPTMFWQLLHTRYRAKTNSAIKYLWSTLSHEKTYMRNIIFTPLCWTPRSLAWPFPTSSFRGWTAGSIIFAWFDYLKKFSKGSDIFVGCAKTLLDVCLTLK